MANKYKIQWDVQPEYAVAIPLRIKRVGKNTLQPEWPDFSAGNKLREWIGVHDPGTQEVIVEKAEDGVALRVSHDWIASRSAAEAAALDLPAETRAGLDLRAHGIPSGPEFRIMLSLKDAGGSTLYRDVVGAFLKADDKIERLPDPLYSVAKAVQPLTNASLPDTEKFLLLDILTEKLESLGGEIRRDAFLQGLRIFYASGMSLRLPTEEGNFDFDPILFGRQVEALESEESVDQDDDALLSQHLNQVFLRDFQNRGESMIASSLGSGAFVFLDPLVAKAVHLTARKKKASPEERRAFALNPRRALKEELADNEEGEKAIDALFIETDQFSERVKAIDVWRKPVLPWIKPKSQSWMPEAFGLRFPKVEPDGTESEVHLEIAPEDAEGLVERLEDAVKKGEPSVEYKSERVPASPAAIQAAKEIAEVARAANTPDILDPETDGENPPAPEAVKKFLVINDNFESVTADFTGEKRDERPSISPPQKMIITFKPHQEDGFKWLATSMMDGYRGVILADDMGLGKTLQALAFIAWCKEFYVKEGRTRKPTLIVAPTALQDNWIAEMDRHFAPGTFGDVEKVTGTYLKSLKTGGVDTQTGTATLDTDRLRDHSILITTYETLRDYHLSFARVAMDVVIFDEAQKIKNPASQVSHSARTLNSDFVLSITGTPVENKLQDLWSIMDATWPGKLGASKDFAQKYDESSESDLRALNSFMREAQKNTAPLMLRRMKAEIKGGLPTRHPDIKIPREMPAEQASKYTDILRRMRNSQDGAKVKILEALTNWRSISVHPNDAPPFDANEVDTVIGQSARFMAAFEALADIKKKKEKTLIFLENLDWQRWLSMAIRHKFGLQDNPMIINGSVPGPKRQNIVDQFQSKPGGFDVLILGPRAAGFGLTITAANHVIHLSRWWNPAVEDQATDRAYRIGQDKDVHVYIPQAVHPNSAIGESSFDLRLDALMERKRQLCGTLLAPADAGEGELCDFFDSVLTETELPAAPEKIKAPSDKPLKRSSEHSPPEGTPVPEDPLPIGMMMRVPGAAIGAARPIEKAFGFLTHGTLRAIRIEDPYLSVPRNFSSTLPALRQHILKGEHAAAAIELKTFHPDHPKVRNKMDGKGANMIKDEICKIFGKPVNCNFDNNWRSKFHDRVVYFTIETPAGNRCVEWQPQGGLDHWFDVGRETSASSLCVTEVW